MMRGSLISGPSPPGLPPAAIQKQGVKPWGFIAACALGPSRSIVGCDVPFGGGAHHRALLGDACRLHGRNLEPMKTRLLLG